MPVRDLAIQRIYARKNHCCYGRGLGIIILDDVYPGFPWMRTPLVGPRKPTAGRMVWQ